MSQHATIQTHGRCGDTGKIRARQNENGKWRIPVNEITRIKTLLMEDA